MPLKVVNLIKKNGRSAGVFAVPSEWIFQSASKEHFCWYPKNEAFGPTAAKSKLPVDPTTFRPYRMEVADTNKTCPSYSETDANATSSESESELVTKRRKKICYINSSESTDDEDNSDIEIRILPKTSNSVVVDDLASSASSVEPTTEQHTCKCSENVAEIRALRVEVTAMSDMLSAFISRLNSTPNESNSIKLDLSLIQQQQNCLTSLQLIEEELQLPCKNLEDFQDLNKRLEDNRVKAVVTRLLRRCSALTAEKTTTSMLQAVIAPNLAVQYNWEGRGEKQPIKDLPIIKLMQTVLQSFPAFKEAPLRKFVAVTMNWLRNAKTRQKTVEKTHNKMDSSL